MSLHAGCLARSSVGPSARVQMLRSSCELGGLECERAPTLSRWTAALLQRPVRPFLMPLRSIEK